MSVDAGHAISNKRSILFYVATIFLTASGLISLSLKLYLLSPYPARQLSTLLSDYLHQPVTVKAVHLSGQSLSLYGLSVADPSGFSGGNLLTATSLTIKPDYRQLLSGQRDFRLIELDGLAIDLHRNSAGTWNFAGLRQLPARPGGPESIIRKLTLRNGSITVYGQTVRGIALTVQDLSTKGSRESRIDLAFQDGAGNRYSLMGTGKGGSEPAFDLNLKGEALSLAGLSTLAKLKDTAYLHQARGDLQLAASLHKGHLKMQGEFDFSRIAAARRINPLSGRLLVRANYQQEKDQARLERLDLMVDNLPQLHGSGTLNGLNNERNFELSLKIDDLDLQSLAAFLPAEKGKQLALTGKLGNTALRVAGSGRQGISAITGGGELQNLSLAKDGRLLISGLFSRVEVGKQASGILLTGEMSAHGNTKAVLESIQAPFSLLLSPKLKLQKAHVGLPHARILGLAVSGQADYDLSAGKPLSTTLQSSSDDLATINPLLDKFGLQIASGTGTGSLQADGRDPQNFSARVDLRLAELHGRKGQTAITLEQGTSTAQITRLKGELSLAGNVEFKGMGAAGKSGQARLDYRLVNKQLTLENSSISWDNSKLILARLGAALPAAESRAGYRYHPLAIEFNGGEISHKGVNARDLSGRINGYLASSGTERWLEGAAELSNGQLAWQGKTVAGPRAMVTFNRAGAKANIGGTLLGGTLSGNGGFKPFNLTEGVSFTIGIHGVELAKTAGLLPSRQKGATIGEGLLDGTMEGSYTFKEGLEAGFKAIGKEVTLVGNGKTLVSRAAINLSGKVAGQTVTVGKVVATAGEGIRFTADGALENAFSVQRQGRFNFTVDKAPFNSYVDAFINSMPRIVQEATVDGSLAAHGTLGLSNGRSLLQGALLLGNLRLDSPAKALYIEDMNGTFPVSLDLTGGTTAVVPKSLDFSRDNFPQLYRQLEGPAKNGQAVTIGKVSFGKMELGTVTLQVTAADGVTQILSLKSSLSEGELLGTGWLQMRKGGSYRGDMLLSGVSLKELCSRFPAIKGYISGRINGIVSLYGKGGGIPQMYGFVDLWANEAKGEKMLVSREFLQRLGGKKLSGIFFRADIPYDRAEISALLEQGYLTFDTLDIVHTNMFGVRDLNISIAPSQNRIALDYLIDSVRQAALSGKAASGQGKKTGEAAPAPEFKWEE